MCVNFVLLRISVQFAHNKLKSRTSLSNQRDLTIHTFHDRNTSPARPTLPIQLHRAFKNKLKAYAANKVISGKSIFVHNFYKLKKQNSQEHEMFFL